MDARLSRRSLVGSLALAALARPARAAEPRARGSALQPIPLSAFSTVVADLRLPEGVAVDRRGQVYVSNEDSACVIVSPGGAMRRLGPKLAGNGVALDGKGGLIIAKYGLAQHEPGGLHRLDLASGALATLASEVGGRALVASNSPMVARDGTIYCTHSKWSDPGRIGDVRPEGFVYAVRPPGPAAVVASGIGGANGCCFDADEAWLYVSQTPAGNILRARRLPSGGFGLPTPFGPRLGKVVADIDIAQIRARIAAGDRDHGYPDGIAFDAEGNLWVTLPFANKLVAITPDERVVTLVSDPAGELIDMPTNLAWGGPDLRDLYVVSRRKGNVVRARSPVPGLPLVGQG